MVNELRLVGKSHNGGLTGVALTQRAVALKNRISRTYTYWFLFDLLDNSCDRIKWLTSSSDQ